MSVGLINYHFKNKEQLITLCTQKIISKVIENFKPEKAVTDKKDKFEEEKLCLKKAACRVFNFLFLNPEISKLLIMNDYQNYTDDTNSWKSIDRFSSMIAETIPSKEKTEKVSFYLINSMQVAFLKSFEVTSFLGYDVKREERERYIDELVDTIMKGVKNAL